MIRLGIIGAGRIGRVHAHSISQYMGNASIKAIADPFMNEETKQWAASLGIQHCYTEAERIFADKAIDAVLICSSTNTHAPLSVQAIEAGKHVFCEKPISQDPAEIEKVVAALEKSPVKYQVGFNRRFDHNFRAVRTAVLGGKIGDVHIVKITSRDPAPPPVSYIKVSGGLFLDMTIHDFDMARYLTGSEVKKVYVDAASLVDPEIGKAGDVDTAIITLTMESGALVVIDNSRAAAYGYDQRAEVFGSKGQIATGNDTLSTAVVSDADGVHGEKPLYFFLERYMQSFTNEMQDFVKAIETGEKVPVGIQDGLQATLIGLAAGESLRQGAPVWVNK